MALWITTVGLFNANQDTPSTAIGLASRMSQGPLKATRSPTVSRWPGIGVESDLAVSVADRSAPAAAGIAGGEERPGRWDLFDDEAAWPGVPAGLRDVHRGGSGGLVILALGDAENGSGLAGAVRTLLGTSYPDVVAKTSRGSRESRWPRGGGT